MTKGQWFKLKAGDKVVYKTWKPVDGKPFDVVLNGTVVRMNSNHSQAFVKFGNDGFESWYGRLTLELPNPIEENNVLKEDLSFIKRLSDIFETPNEKKNENLNDGDSEYWDTKEF